MPSETTHTLKTADGATLAYRRSHCDATAPGVPLLFIHGAASNVTRWSELVETTTLAETRDLLRVDLRGHAQSLHRCPTSLEIWSDDIAAILAHENIPRAILVGHCLGANVAAMFAARHPDKTAGLVLVEPMLRDALTGTLRHLKPLAPLLRIAIIAIRLLNRLGIQRRRLETLDLRALDNEFRQHLAKPGGIEALVERYASPLEDLKTMPAANYLSDLVEVMRPLPLEKIRAPFLALLSTGRALADPPLTRTLLSTLPRGEIVDVEAKHWIPTEQPEAMRSAIEAWCARLGS